MMISGKQFVQVLATIVVTLGAAGGHAQTPGEANVKGAPATIADLSWLSGSWTGTAGASTIEEHWTAPGGGSMLAVARTIREGRLRAFEFLRIAEANGTLLYLAMPNGRSPATPFTLTKIDPTGATFENPAHDFPKKIRYTLASDGTLEAEISGDAAQKPQTFRFSRSKH
jgi:hypothetical protein